ncbi:anti-sigma factor family protein [Nannocystis pusilla]|uniref:anti-sigma factor family protein n=1 Tax=Nannocystis pusilla TaxID=889268 RepID=UPI003BF2919A
MSHDLHTLQPFIDGELTEAERAEVEAQLARDPAMREVAEEQLRIRQLLRDLPRATAPQALRARVLLELDAIDRETAPKPAAAPQRSRWRNFLRGGALMLPAGAAAFGLFLVARTLPGPAAPTRDAGPRDLAVRLVDVPEDSSPLQPVALPTGDDVIYEVGPRRVIDHRDQATADALPERVQLYRGSRYHLGRGADGRPQVVFDVGGVRHTLREDPDRVGEVSLEQSLEALLELGHLVRTSANAPRAR